VSDFLLYHGGFARWGLLYLILGLLLSLAWGWSFRRLRDGLIVDEERRWEAWRGVAGGVTWLLSLALILLLQISNYDIRSVEALTASDDFPLWLIEAIAEGKGYVVAPALLMFAVALGTLAVVGWWSGAWAARQGRSW